LLIHGSTTDASLWNDTRGELGEDRTLYLLNRRGRGGSTDESAYDVEREGQDVLAVIQALAMRHGEGAKLDVVAHSFGALCLLKALPASAPQIGRLVLYEPPLLPADLLPDESFVAAMRSELEAGRNEAVVEMFFRRIELLNDRQLAKLRSMSSWRMRVAAAPTIPRELEAVRSYRLPSFSPGQVQPPVLFLVGGISPPVMAEATRRVAECFQHPLHEVLPGQRHGAMNSSPALFVDTLRAFLT